MILKVAIPGKMQFKMIRREPSFLLSGQGDIHYIGGAEVLPPPLESEKENEIISDLGYLRRNNKTRLEVSIDEPLNVDWDGNELLLSDILGTDEDVIYRDIENEVERKLLLKAINKLTDREKTIINLRFGLNTPDGQEMTQKEVATLLGISQSYISRLEKKIMKRLKREMVKE